MTFLRRTPLCFHGRRSRWARRKLQMKPHVPCMIFALTVGLPTAALRADNWSQFRGPELSGVAKDAKLPLEWGPDKQIVWKIELPGAGWSQPIVWGDKVFVTTAQSSKGAKPDRSV